MKPMLRLERITIITNDIKAGFFKQIQVWLPLRSIYRNLIETMILKCGNLRWKHC